LSPDATSCTTSLAGLRRGGKAALARTLAALESEAGRRRLQSLLDQAHAAPLGHVLGLTGPPGVGKSSLLSRLIGRLRARGQSVAVVAVDPSSGLSGGALLGDRVRLELPADDPGTFVRSLASGGRLGGLADAVVPFSVLLRALFDVTIVETVGVGQSETEIGLVADTTILVVQPASGDSLQFIKAGIIEIPDILVVGKADLGAAATRAQGELEAAVGHRRAGPEGWRPPVVLISALTGLGLDALMAVCDRHATHLGEGRRLATRRHAQSHAWLAAAIKEAHGRHGLARASQALAAARADTFGSPFLWLDSIDRQLRAGKGVLGTNA